MDSNDEELSSIVRRNVSRNVNKQFQKMEFIFQPNGNTEFSIGQTFEREILGNFNRLDHFKLVFPLNKLRMIQEESQPFVWIQSMNGKIH